MFKRWDEITHASKCAYEFRGRYFMNPLMRLAEKTPWFDKKITERYFQELKQLYAKWLLNATVLDIGCGPGRCSQDFSENYRIKSYLGLDYSFGMSRDAKKDNPGKNFICGNVYSLPFRDNSFDIVHSTRLFHHLKPELRIDAIMENLRVANVGVIIEDLFGFEKGIWRYPHQLYYTLADGSYYRYSLREWQLIFDKINSKVLQHIYTHEKMIMNRCACWVIKAA
jgi:ubiquinone/menaquinone biosynthesis C-methylase UbiE